MHSYYGGSENTYVLKDIFYKYLLKHMYFQEGTVFQRWNQNKYIHIFDKYIKTKINFLKHCYIKQNIIDQGS